MNKAKIFIACDTTSTKKLTKIIKQSITNKLQVSYKIGLEFFLSPKGRNFIAKLVKNQASLAKLAKLDGIVCSGNEVKFLKKICKNMEIVTPGIRLLGDDKGDQKRVMTPKEAFKNGATSIVMGRSITKGNIKNNIQKLIKSLN